MEHVDIPPGEIHKPHNYEYANEAARLAATGFAAGDVGKLALQLSDLTYWILSATTPTWASLAASGPQGIQGPAGADGATGAQGPQGIQGATGPAGPTTWDGITDKPATFTPATHNHDGVLPVFDLATYAAAAAGDYCVGWANAMTALESAGGGIIQVPAGVTDIAGPLLDTGRANAQLLLPSRHAVNAKQITVVIRGVRPPPTTFSVVGDTPVPDNHSVLRSTLVTGSGGQLLGGKGPVGSFADLSMVLVVMQGVAFRMPSNPTHSAVDLSHMTGCVVDGVVVDAGSYYIQGVTQPTTATSYGIKFPKNGNGADTRIGCINVAGFYTGVRISEHTNAEQINAWGCLRAAEFDYGQHASHVKRLMAVHCPRAIVATGGQSQVDIDQLNIEHADAGWFVPVYDIDDVSNYWRGRARWNVVLANVGVDGTFTVNGAAGVELARIGYPFAPGISAQTASYTATALDAGKIIRINAAGATTLTIPPDSTTLFAICTELHLQQAGAGATTITAGAGVTINRPASQTLATKEQYAVATVKKVAANSWVAFGMLGAA